MQPWEEEVIFVTGVARSGTTLMQGLLAASEDVMEPAAECAFLRDLATAYAGGLRDWRSFTHDLFVDANAYRDLNRRIVGLYLEQLRERFATAKRLLQKAPSIAPQVSALANLLPNAAFVVMLRDPRDTIASQFVRWQRVGKKINLARQLQRYTQLNALLRRQHAKLPGRMALVRYEGLVQDPVGTMDRIAEFLGVRPPADPAGLAWRHKRQRDDPSASRLDGRPVSAETVASFRRTLPPAMLATIEAHRTKIEEKIGLPVFHDADSPTGPAVLV